MFKIKSFSSTQVQEKKQIVWLASYPKSGNTWFRSFLTAVLSEKEVDLNNLATEGIFSWKNYMETILDLDSDYLSHTQIEQFQRISFNHLSSSSSRQLFIKIHDAFTLSENDHLPLIPEKSTKIAIYFVRNPLDVTLSLANHLGRSIENTINDFIINPKGCFASKKNSTLSQFYQPLGTWSMHVESWLTSASFPVHFIRYEDMKEKPFETFKAALNAIGIECSDKSIQFAIEETKFEKLKKREIEQGFKENLLPSSNFFFKGQVGRWKEVLTSAQIESIRTINRPMMQKFGYW
jgi:Sulfotransferase domain